MRTKLKQSFKDMGIFHKTALITITITCLISIISNSFLLLRFSGTIKTKDRLLIQESSRRVENTVQAKYNMVYNQQTLIHSTNFIASIITATRTDPSSIYRPEYLSRISDYLEALGYSDADILDAILFTEDGENAFSYSRAQGRRILLSYPYVTIPYVQDFGDSDANITIIYDPDPPYLSLSSKNVSREVITLLAKVYDTNHPVQRILTGYLLINIAPQTLDNVYRQLDEGASGNYLVVNHDSTVVYSNNPYFVNQQYTSDLIPASDILYNSSISLSGITIIGSVSERTLRANISSIIRQGFLVTTLGLVALMMAVALLHRYYSRKFRQITSAMKQIGEGDFSAALPEVSNDEIGELIQAFNTMREALDAYIKKNYLAETQRRTAELYALQAQINPHFLNNTIESIRMKALNEGQYEISEMLASFGVLFRWMIQFNDNIVCAEDEIDYIDAYLDLQRLRFGDRLNVQIDIPTETLFLGIPRFTLQPIVENTLSHAVKSSGESLLISIRFRVSGKLLVLTVEDDGNGMSEDTLERLRSHISGEKEFSEFGIALKNVHTRIQLLFGSQYGLSIQSTQDQGTIIEITLPVIEKEEGGQYV